MKAISGWAADLGRESGLDAALADLLSRGAVDVPPYPAVALRIARLMQGGDYGLDDLARLAGSDQALAIDLLRAANSAQYARGAPVTSLQAAVQRVGAGELARIALASGLGAHALAAGPLAPLRRRAWHQALSSAVLCRELARARGEPPEEAFTCGLLHDFGAVVAAACLERLAAGARSARTLPARLWEAVLERWHVPAGRALAARWDLPPAVVEAIALHHQADLSGAAAPGLVEVVKASDPLARILVDQPSLTVADARAIRALSDADVAAVEEAIVSLPGFVASFEREARGGAPTLLEPVRPAPGIAAAPGVTLRLAGAEHRVTGFAPHQLFVRGPAPLPEGVLLEAEVLGGAPAAFHARVVQAWAEPGGGHGAALVPFALTGPALLLWKGLVPSAGEA